MVKGGRQGAKAAIVALGACVIALALALSVGWVVISWQAGLLLALGIVFFGVIITGVVLNTIFLLREIRRNEQHDAFINSVTHELKTPIASIRLYLQTLQSRQVEESKRNEFYGIMLADSDRLLGTVNQVLRAAHSSSSRRASRSSIDLREIVRECVDLARTQHHLPSTALNYREAVAGATVLGDGEELKAAISNLIDNAVKYSGSPVKVAVELAESETGKLRVRVQDNGIGIADTELKRVFKRFYRIPSTVASRVKGTGLGLFIVKSVAERHGGRAYAQSAGTGHGSTFTLEIPFAKPS